MKIGLIGINVGGPDIGELMEKLALKAEEMGLESLWTFEHVCRFVEYSSRYPGSADGKLPGPLEQCYIDPLIALTHLAAKTRRVRLGTGINILPQTNPLLLAKQAASLDSLSGGRLMLGVGAGWAAEEFQALGVPFERRGARMNDYLTAMKKVWSEDVVEHQSDFIDWRGFKSHPLPVQKPHPPIYIGGVAEGALRRVVNHGDGWLAGGQPMEIMSRLCETLNRLADEAGRDPASIDLNTMWVPGDSPLDGVRRYEDLGFSRLLIRYGVLGEDPLAGLDRLADEVLAKL